MGFLQSLSVEQKGLRYKLMIAFSLMSIIPLLILTYFVTNYIFEAEENTFQLAAVVMFTLWIAFTGYLLAKNIIMPVIGLSIAAKKIATGSYDSKILMEREDELGEIASAVNSMTGRMSGYLGKLREYSKETASLNVRIHRKVLTLTNLMGLGDLISEEAEFEEIADYAAEKIAGELYGGFCAIFTKEGENKTKYVLKSFTNNSGKESIVKSLKEELPLAEDLFKKNEYLLVDAHPLRKRWQKELREKLGHINAVIFSMKLNATVVGVILFGNFGREFSFSAEDIEVLRAFEKELILGYQSAQVRKRVKKLEVVDNLTGLYTFSYLQDRLDDEIKRSVYYQRPCSLILIDVDDFEKYTGSYGSKKAEQVLIMVAKLLSGEMLPVGKVARSGRDEFGILLPEMNKREALSTGEDIRKKIEKMELSMALEDRITVSIGIGENPIDGANAKDIIAKARLNIKKAKTQGKNTIVGE
ncbi:MAG: diguanylate cyclase [Candidatus Omnitrophota bacterium]